ncbi:MULTISPECIES: hypothetical protein [Pseudomonas]|uniref:hypothetical protein n=1 Tax=Pseudomonas TaxID=286 RepID=UPI0015B5359D|nr:MULTISPECIES: hypothetical protein [Pseudomonas]
MNGFARDAKAGKIAREKLVRNKLRRILPSHTSQRKVRAMKVQISEKVARRFRNESLVELKRGLDDEIVAPN